MANNGPQHSRHHLHEGKLNCEVHNESKWPILSRIVAILLHARIEVHLPQCFALST